MILMHRLSFILTLFAALSSSTLRAEDKPKEAPKPTQAELDATAAIKKAGGSVTQLAQDDNRWDVSFHLAEGKMGDDQIATVKPLANVIHELNLGKTEVTDKGLEHIKGFKSLVKLNLKETKITDAGLAQLTGLANLEY